MEVGDQETLHRFFGHFEAVENIAFNSKTGSIPLFGPIVDLSGSVLITDDLHGKPTDEYEAVANCNLLYPILRYCQEVSSRISSCETRDLACEI